MIKWLKSLTRQEKVMVSLILVLLIGVILRWDNIKQKAGIWFHVHELVEEEEDTAPADSLVVPIDNCPVIDSIYLEANIENVQDTVQSRSK